MCPSHGDKTKMKNDKLMRYNICCVCYKPLRSKWDVFNGVMGVLWNILFFWDKSWKEMSTCQECRDMAMAGYSTEDIIELRRGHNKC